MKFCLLLIVLVETALVDSKHQPISGEYVSFWGETLWTYKFNANGRYIYTTSGHFGDSKTVGTYRLSNDTLYLTASLFSKQANPKFYFKADTLFKLSDTCLVDLSLGYEYCKAKGWTIMASRKRDTRQKGMPVVD